VLLNGRYDFLAFCTDGQFAIKSYGRLVLKPAAANSAGALEAPFKHLTAFLKPMIVRLFSGGFPDSTDFPPAVNAV
jgi:hypothetical protein